MVFLWRRKKRRRRNPWGMMGPLTGWRRPR